MFREGGLRCDFPPEETRRPEEENRELKLVDFVWQAPEMTWLVEVKDPEDAPPPMRAGAVRGLVAELSAGKLDDKHFLPKLFGTYVWLSRQGALRPLAHRYAVLVATGLDTPLRISVTDRVQRAIDAVGPLDRATGRAPVAEVHDLRSWNDDPNRPAIVREP